MCAAWLTAHPARAGEAEERAAAAWLGRGNAAFREGRFAEAEKAYREAWTLKKGYDVAGNLGAAELAQGKTREAAEHLAFTLRLFPLTGDPALRERMQKALSQCRHGVGAVRIQVDPPGAQIVVDGAPRGTAPLADEVFVEPGEHLVEARLSGYTVGRDHVRVGAGASVGLTLLLRPLPGPRAQVVELPAPKRRSAAPALALGGGALVGFGLGAALIGLSASRRSDAASVREAIRGGGGSCVQGAGNFDGGRCPALTSKLHADDTLHDVGVGAFVTGAAAAAGAVTYLLWPTPRAGRAVRVGPVFDDKGGGLQLSGRF
jgi:tetratricopeptide (TPR) repeat protein